MITEEVDGKKMSVFVQEPVREKEEQGVNLHFLNRSNGGGSVFR